MDIRAAVFATLSMAVLAGFLLLGAKWPMAAIGILGSAGCVLMWFAFYRLWSK